NLVLYGNARLTTNPSLSPLDRDHLSATALARALFGRLATEVGFRSTWFFADADRSVPRRTSTLLASLSQTFWLGQRHRVELAVSMAAPLDARPPEALMSLAWEGSRGRLFRDHTPLDGEDYFFAQRGPAGGGPRLVAR